MIILVTCSLALTFVKPTYCQKSLTLAVFVPQTSAESNDHDSSVEGGSNDHDVSAHVDEVERIIQGIRLAAQDINNRQDLLHGYQIQLDIRDTKVSKRITYFYPSHSLDSIIQKRYRIIDCNRCDANMKLSFTNLFS